RGHPTEGDHCAVIEFADPHSVCQKAKQCRLRIFERIDLRRATTIWQTSLAIHPETESDTSTNEHKRNKQHRLNQTPDLEMHRFAEEIVMQPWPRRREHHT